MNFVRGGIDAGIVTDNLLQSRRFPADAVELLPIRVDEIRMDMNLAFTSIGENDEFVAEVAADRPGVGAHRDGFQPHAGKRA